jgi:anthranilate phosphoribosyltransferase
MVKQTLEKLSQQKDLCEQETQEIMHAIMDGAWTPSQIAGLLMGLKIKGETVDEITGFVKVMRARASRIQAPADSIDTCGTGGDGSGTFNISTAAAIVAAAAGVPVAKHGNRSVSSRCGSADVLQALGVKVDLSPEQAERCIAKTGIAFLFAPVYHASMKHAVVPRREMGIRTVFNILGPMSNPAGTQRQIMGVFDRKTAEKMVQVMKNTGSDHVMAVSSDDGLDEISLHSKTHVYELKNGDIDYYQIDPADFGFPKKAQDGIIGGDEKENAEIISRILQGSPGPQFDVAALNAGAAIYVGGKAGTLRDGVSTAKDAIQSGLALKKLQELIEQTNSVNC